MRVPSLIVVAMTLFGAHATLGAPVPKEKSKTNAEKVLGKWKLVRSSNGGEKLTSLVVEFTKDGKMTLTQSDGDGKSVYDGTYKIDGDKLPYKMNLGSEMKSETLTIKKLTDDELIVVDPDNVQEDFKRVVLMK